MAVEAVHCPACGGSVPIVAGSQVTYCALCGASLKPGAGEGPAKQADYKALVQSVRSLQDQRDAISQRWSSELLLVKKTAAPRRFLASLLFAAGVGLGYFGVIVLFPAIMQHWPQRLLLAALFVVVGTLPVLISRRLRETAGETEARKLRDLDSLYRPILFELDQQISGELGGMTKMHVLNDEP
jgi:hypothetical protein